MASICRCPFDLGLSTTQSQPLSLTAGVDLEFAFGLDGAGEFYVLDPRLEAGFAFGEARLDVLEVVEGYRGVCPEAPVSSSTATRLRHRARCIRVAVGLSSATNSCSVHRATTTRFTPSPPWYTTSSPIARPCSWPRTSSPRSPMARWSNRWISASTSGRSACSRTTPCCRSPLRLGWA